MSIRESKNIEEQDLWNSFAQGNNGSLEILYRRYFDTLFAYGNKWLNNPSLTEDSIQDLFVKLMRNRANLSIPASVRHYLFRSFRSVVLDKLKAKNKTSFIDEPGEHLFPLELSPEQQAIVQEEEDSLRKNLASALERLTPRQREAVFLRYAEGFSYEVISEMMELTPKATYKLMARALVALKQQISGASLLFILKNIFF